MSTLSSANVTDVNLIVLKERTHVRLCINMLIFTHNLGNWLIRQRDVYYDSILKEKVSTYINTSTLYIYVANVPYCSKTN